MPDDQPPPTWDDAISEDRQRVLRQHLETWADERDHGDRKGPFDRRPDGSYDLMLTGADVSWLAGQVRDQNGTVPRLHLEGALLQGARLEGARLGSAHLEGAVLTEAHLEGAHLDGASLARAYLSNARLEGADLRGADLRAAQLKSAHLEGAWLGNAHLDDANLQYAYLAGASFARAHLDRASLGWARLGAKDVAQADWDRIRTWKPDFPARLPPTNLSRATLTSETELDNMSLTEAAEARMWVSERERQAAERQLRALPRRERQRRQRAQSIGPQLAGVRWGGATLSKLNWKLVHTLADEEEARTAGTLEVREGEVRLVAGRRRMVAFQEAVRANRGLALELYDQGLNTDADRFAYRAQVCQWKALRYGRQWPSLALWSFLGLVSGFGYKLWRIVAAYGVILVVFAGIYWWTGVHSFTGESGIQTLWDSFLVSLAAIHGRAGVEMLTAWSVAAWVAAVESVVGIVIEGVFIAMLIQRFFAR